MTTLLSAALGYGALGLRVFPLKPDGTPKISQWPDKASADEIQIRRWWESDPEAGIGLACGDELATGRFLFVIDLDRHEPGADGVELWQDYPDAPDGPVSLTGRDGHHLFFTAPVPVTNARGTLPRGIDVRGRGGYVVLPPTIHRNGVPYAWELSSELGEVKIPKAPEWLLDVLAGEPELEQAPTPTKPTPRDDFYDSDLDDRPGTAWAEQTTWNELLERDGWQYVRRTREGHDEWVRPGKDPREGISATTGFGGGDTLVVHSTNANVPAESYSKLGYLATAHHGGDYSSAARSVAPDRPESSTKAPEPSPVFPAATDGEEWPEPLPLTDRDVPISFPLDVFPDWIRNQVDQAAGEMQLEPDLPAMLALGALSTASGGYVEVIVDRSYKEPTNLYLVTALPPGAGKSPVFKMLLEGPLGDFERDLDESGAAQRERNALLRRMAEKEVEKAVSAGNEAALLEAHQKLTVYEDEPTPKIFVDDVTVERLAEIMKEQKGKLALVSTEGGLFDQITGRYSEKTNLDPYLMAWSGDTIRVDRIQRGELRVYDPALTVALTVQPTVIEKLADRPELAGRGLTARFMYSYPVDRVGSRHFDRESSYDLDVAAVYAGELLDLARTLRDAHGTAKLVLKLEPSGAKLIREMKDEHEPRMRYGGDLYEMREWITKAQSSTIRVAALLHLADRKGQNLNRTTGELLPDDVISADTVEKALRILDYWVAHARRVHDLFSVDSEIRVAQRLLDWIIAHVEAGEDFSLRDVTQWSRSGEFSRSRDVVAPLGELVEAGWIRPTFEGPIPTGRGKKSPIFTLTTRTSVRLTQAHQAHSVTESEIDGEKITESESSEPMSLMSQETNQSSISLSETVKDPERGDTSSHEAHEAHYLEEQSPGEGRPCPLL